MTLKQDTLEVDLVQNDIVIADKGGFGVENSSVRAGDGAIARGACLVGVEKLGVAVGAACVIANNRVAGGACCSGLGWIEEDVPLAVGSAVCLGHVGNN